MSGQDNLNKDELKQRLTDEAIDAMQMPDAPTAGAMRAALLHNYGQLLPDNCADERTEQLARLIDRETGLRELMLFTMEVTEAFETLTDFNEIRQEVVEQGRAALDKARGNTPEEEL